MSVDYSKHAVTFQVYGGKSVSSHTRPAAAWAPNHMPLLAAKPDKRHRVTVKRLELKKQP
jgi:hypothetical protein